MSHSKKIRPLQTAHGKPKTRREFLSYGLVPFAASLFLPNPFKWLQGPSFLEGAWGSPACPNSEGHQWIPFVQIDLAGGAALMANFVPMDAQGSLLPSYSLMGLGRTPSIIRQFGGAPFYTRSGLLVGIQARTSEAARSKLRSFSLCVQSGDDRSSNLLAMNGLIQKIGANGSYLPHLGNRNSPSVGNHQPALVGVEGPLNVNNFTAITSSIGFTGALNALNAKQKEKLVQIARKLNSVQSTRLAEQSGVTELKQIVECAGLKNQELVSLGSNLVDPRQNQAIAQIWGINSNTAANNQDLIFSSMVFNTLNKQAGSSTLVLGGYDYHGQARDATDALDRNAGELIGRIVASAEALNTPVFIAVTSDGSVSSVNSEQPSPFNSDRGSAGMILAFLYHPSKDITLNKFQLGHFEAGQLASERSLVGGSTERAVAALILNYLALHNQIGKLDEVTGQRIFNRSEIDSLIVWG
jgi:hypothetical protein